jgi:hypothetical protein
LNPDFTLASTSGAGPTPTARLALSTFFNPSRLVPTAEANLRLYQSALAATVHALQAAGKQVILVQDMPSFALDPPVLVRTAHIPARRALAFALAPSGHINTRALIDPGYLPPESSPDITASQDLIRQASQQLSALLFDPKPALCPTSVLCAYRDGDTLLFNDSTHVSAAGATHALASFPLPVAR